MTIKEFKKILDKFPEDSAIGIFKFSSLRNKFVFQPVTDIVLDGFDSNFVGIEFGVPVER